MAVLDPVQTLDAWIYSSFRDMFLYRPMFSTHPCVSGDGLCYWGKEDLCTAINALKLPSTMSQTQHRDRSDDWHVLSTYTCILRGGVGVQRDRARLSHRDLSLTVTQRDRVSSCLSPTDPPATLHGFGNGAMAKDRGKEDRGKEVFYRQLSAVS